MFNRETHKSRGFGFIVFELEKGAEQVCAEKEHVIDGKVVSFCTVATRSRSVNPSICCSYSTTSPMCIHLTLRPFRNAYHIASAG